MNQSSPLCRQWMMLRLLSTRRYGATVEEMAAEFEMNERTIRRDLALLKSLGFPLVEILGDHSKKSWKLDADQPFALSFTFDEALALYIARRLLEPLAGTMLWEAAQQAFRKIRASLPEPSLAYLDKMASAVHPTGTLDSRYASRRDLIDQLMLAIEDRKVAFLSYQSQSATEPVSYEVEPLGIAWHRNGSLYLVAHSREHDELRHFKIDRMQDVDVQPFPFHPPSNFDLEKHFAGSFGIWLSLRTFRDHPIAATLKRVVVEVVPVEQLLSAIIRSRRH